MYAYIDVYWIQAKVSVKLWLVMCDITVLSFACWILIVHVVA